MKDINDKIYNYSLETIMGERFGAYSRYIIQDRAIPDVRDGLKPVQRRILYAMKKDGNTYNNKFKKCAKAVGSVLGTYHPHGDVPVYDALVRLSQDWKQNTPLIEIDGNNGSIDGDPPAAYRYTECRLTKISEELLGDVDKFEAMKINFAPNFDDTKLEPTVLPARFPNLLVNGCSGISAGYATNMPPHNLGEIIDATIKRIDSPNCSLETILNIVKGPDFPKGGIIEGIDGLKKAYETGRGKISVMSKYEFVKEKGKEKIIITEIPYEVNKALLVQKIDEIRIDKKIDGISEIRDESDKEANLRIVIDLKTNANKELVINYLLKNTDLMTSYNFNNVAIVNRRPRLLGIIPIIDAYIDFQKEIVKSASEWDLKVLKHQYHVTEGLVKAISILDEVIRVIRASKNKSDAKNNLIKEFEFTLEQAEAIVTLQLYRLTNTDIVSLEEKMKELKNEMERLSSIIDNPEILNNEIKTTLKNIKKEYATKRKTEIRNTVTDISFDATDLIPNERVMIVLTTDGYLKRVSKKSFTSSGEITGLKPGDSVMSMFKASTLDKLLIILSGGNYIYLPVYDIPEMKWKEMGKHVSNMVTMSPDEKVISSFIINSSTKDANLITVSKFGMVKKTTLSLYNVTRYNKEMTAMKLKESDEIVSAFIEKSEIIISTKNGYTLRFNTGEIPLSGVKTAGVKGIILKDDDEVVSSGAIDISHEYLTIFTDNKTAKRVKISEIEISSRAKRGSLIIKKVKSNVYHISSAILSNSKSLFNIKYNENIEILKASDIAIMDTSSTGSSFTKNTFNAIYLEPLLIIIDEKNNDEKPKIEEDNKNFLEEFKL